MEWGILHGLFEEAWERRRRRRLWLMGAGGAAAAAAAVVLLGSGGDGGGDPAATPHPAPAPAPALAVRVTAAPVHRHDRVVVGITAALATGLAGHVRRSYTVESHAVTPASGCVNNRDRAFPDSAAGGRVRAALDPARGEGGPAGWCRGRFAGTVTYHQGYACPARGICHVPRGFPRQDRVVARFSYRVR